jgi:hypothetical protein
VQLTREGQQRAADARGPQAAATWWAVRLMLKAGGEQQTQGGLAATRGVVGGGRAADAEGSGRKPDRAAKRGGREGGRGGSVQLMLEGQRRATDAGREC